MSKIITRSEAIALGLKRYFTGIPCKHGHIAERFVTGFLCYACTDLNAKQWAAKNKARKDEVDAAYRKNNREALRAKAARRYKENPIYRAETLERAKRRAVEKSDQIKDYLRNYQKNNRETANIKNSEWRKRNLGLCNFWSAMRRANIRNATPMWADAGKIQTIYEECARFSRLTGISHEVDHIYPLKGKLVCGLHVHHNLQIITKTENVKKHNKHPEDIEMPTVTAIEPHDGHRPGASYDVSEQRAKELIHKGLVKMKGPPANKMQPENRHNKKSPSQAAGAGTKSSASPVAPASRRPTARPSAGGASKSQPSDE